MSMTRASDLMTKRFLRISTEHTIREAMGIILYGEQTKHDTGAIAIINQEGDFAGVVTPNQIVWGLVGDWKPVEGNSGESEFLPFAESRLSLSVSTLLTPEPTTASPQTSLARLVLMAGASESECIPVIDEGRVEGLVYATDIFKAAADIALTPGTEGIAL